MSDKIDENTNNQKLSLATWERPKGPLNVWKKIDLEEQLEDGSKIPIKVSIQDIPTDRYDDAVDLMCIHFVGDEATCKCLNLSEDPDALEDFRSLWSDLLNIGVSVGAFTLNEDGDLLDLIGVNILFAVNEELDRALEDFSDNCKSENVHKIFSFLDNLMLKVDIRQIYKIETYLSALGLIVVPEFRGQKLGVHILEARDDICRKYGLKGTATLFTSESSQKQAERAGFKTLLEKFYAEELDEDGSPLFPNITAKSVKLMAKKIQ